MIRSSSLPPQPPPPPLELQSSSSQSGGRVRFLCKTARNKNRSLGQNGRWVFFKARGFRYLASKLSKRKVDDSLHMLHSILFGKKTKAHNLNRNIGQFSDYVWAENEFDILLPDNVCSTTYSGACFCW
ncbi:hypothetical protein P8452_02362 [Trifolium repens]|nr:hypothetical protein P8452_02362 [Trifolium repens]